MVKMAKLKKLQVIVSKAFAYLKHLILSALGLKWESYLESELKSWEKWFTPSLYTWKGRFEAHGYRVDLDSKQPLSSNNYLRWESLQHQLGLNYSGEEILIADIGSGPSGIGYTIKGRDTKLICLDPLLEKYRRMAFYKKNVFDRTEDKFMCVGVAEAIPFKSGVLDIVFCINVLDHCKDPAKVLEEIRRVLKEEGILILDVDVWIDRKPLVIDAHPSRVVNTTLEKLFLKDHFEIISGKLLYKQFGYGGPINRILLPIQNFVLSKTSKFGEAFYILRKI
jgi:SAM-dependent methyltransferase